MNRSYAVLRVSAFFFRPHFFPSAVMRGEERSREPLQVLQQFINISLNMKLSKPSVAITYLWSSLSKLLSISWPLSELTQRSFNMSNTEPSSLKSHHPLSPLCNHLCIGPTSVSHSCFNSVQCSICHWFCHIACPGITHEHRKSSLAHARIF